jgi:hypothetical protein
LSGPGLWLAQRRRAELGLPLGRVKVWQLRCLGLELRSGLPLGRVKVWQLRGLGLELGCPKRRGSYPPEATNGVG